MDVKQFCKKNNFRKMLRSMIHFETMDTVNKGGRPPSTGEARNVPIQVAFTKQEKDRYQEIAYRLDLSLAQLVRRALAEYTTKSGFPSEHQVDIKKEVQSLSTKDLNDIKVSGLMNPKPENIRALSIRYDISINSVLYIIKGKVA